MKKHLIALVKKLALILLMFLLPLQMSWAAVANYCGHEENQTADHFAHHDAEHEHFYSAQDDEAPSEKSEIHYDHCHLSGYLGFLTVYEFKLSQAALAVSSVDNPEYPSLLPDQPERPKWATLA